MNKQMMQQTIDQMLQLAATEPAFDALCRKDPDRAFAQVAGAAMPAGGRLRVVEIQPGEVLLPMPAPGQDSAGLRDQELEAVVGGAGGLGAVNYANEEEHEGYGEAPLASPEHFGPYVYRGGPETSEPVLREPLHTRNLTQIAKGPFNKNS